MAAIGPYSHNKMAALRNFARIIVTATRNHHNYAAKTYYTIPLNVQITKRFASFKSSPVYDEHAKYTHYEVSHDPVEWSYVTRLFKLKYIPTPPKSIETSASGWKSPRDESKKLPYFVNRTKNHMQPVYIHRKNRNLRRVTVLRKVDGDIVSMEADLKKYIVEATKKEVGTQICEPSGIIKFRGDYVNLIKKWLDERGF